MTKFVQDNDSRSARNTVRGLHNQIELSQGKLVRAVAGEVVDVVVGIRHGSPTLGLRVREYLSEENKKMMWIPACLDLMGFMAWRRKQTETA